MSTEFQRLSQASLLEHIETVGAVKFTIRNIVCYGTRNELSETCLLYTSPSPRDRQKSRMPSSA